MSDYGSEGWEFESLRARKDHRRSEAVSASDSVTGQTATVPQAVPTTARKCDRHGCESPATDRLHGLSWCRGHLFTTMQLTQPQVTG